MKKIRKKDGTFPSETPDRPSEVSGSWVMFVRYFLFNSFFVQQPFTNGKGGAGRTMGCGSSSCASQPGPVSGGFGRKPHVKNAAEAKTTEEAVRAAEKAHAERLAQLAEEWAALGGASVALQPCKPLRERIGLGARRHERGEWKTLLSAPTTLHEQGRDTELDLKILRGDITADVRVYVLQQDKRIVSFLLSSTFTDTEWERNLLIDDVVPYLQDYARKHGFEFRLAEMRWCDSVVSFCCVVRWCCCCLGLSLGHPARVQEAGVRLVVREDNDFECIACV